MKRIPLDLRRTGVAVLATLLLTVASCASSPGPTPPASVAPPGSPAAVCDHQAPGPATAPPNAVTVDPALDGQLARAVKNNPAGTTFWLAPGRHTLGGDQYDQVMAKDGDVFIGAPGAVVDGRGVNQYAFTTEATNVQIRHLTVQGFVPPQDQGVVNHDSGDGWVIEDNVIQNNGGAGLMAGAKQQVRRNCLRNNGQYGMNAYQAAGGITGLVVEDNEIVGNNTQDWERRQPGCGCTGGVKFWSVNGADVRGNWVHDNRGAGLWADTNNNDFLVERNLIERNDGEAVFYETSYNLVLRDNVIRNNNWVTGKMFADRKDTFPAGTVYLSESGGEPRVPARTDKIDIYGNTLQNNWGGITAWENADRFCNSPANTSTGVCTRLVTAASQCGPPAIAGPPERDLCRWKTQRVEVHDNTFAVDPNALGCPNGPPARMAVLSNYGSYPDWSPYKGAVVQEAITFRQQVVWRNNTYTGPWSFVAHDTSVVLDANGWRAAPYAQDAGSTMTPYRPSGKC